MSKTFNDIKQGDIIYVCGIDNGQLTDIYQTVAIEDATEDRHMIIINVKFIELLNMISDEDKKTVEVILNSDTEVDYYGEFIFSIYKETLIKRKI